MRTNRFFGFLRLSLAHHPLCSHYQNHVIHMNGIGLCLGCTGFYSGLGSGILIYFLSDIELLEWEFLIIIATLLYIPTILRLLNLPKFNTSERKIRLIYRFFLGLGVVIGFISIFQAPNLIIGGFQFLLGIALYFSIGIRRLISKDYWKECEDCRFTPSPECPGFIPFHLIKFNDKTLHYPDK